MKELAKLNESLEQRVAERTEELVTSNKRYRALIDASTQAVWTTDAKGRVKEDSPSWRAFTGHTYAQWEGYGGLNAVHPEDRVFAEKNWRESVASKDEVDTEFRLYHQGSDSWHLTRVRAVPLLRADGTLQGYVGMND